MVKTFTHSEAYTAMCLWEAVMDMHYAKNMPPAMARFREANGFNSLRQLILDEVVNLAEVTWDWANETYDEPFDGYAFDWEFCPAVLLHLPWERCSQAGWLPNYEDLYKQVHAYLTAPTVTTKKPKTGRRQLTL